MAEEAGHTGLPPVIQRLIAWRERNGVSRRGAVVVMKRYGVVVSQRTLEAWEQGTTKPGTYSSQLVDAFLREHPIIDDPPHFPPGPPPGFRETQ